MAISSGQKSATATAQTLCTTPSERGLVIITNDSSSANEAYVGVASGSLTPAGGIPLPVGQSLPFPCFADGLGSKTIQVVCQSGQTATVGYLISSDSATAP